jgi:hypothetical protein
MFQHNNLILLYSNVKFGILYVVGIVNRLRAGDFVFKSWHLQYTPNSCKTPRSFLPLQASYSMGTAVSSRGEAAGS